MTVDRPDVAGRVKILKVHSRDKVRPGPRPQSQLPGINVCFVGCAAFLGIRFWLQVLAPDVDLEVIARRTPGFTGADLQNVMNEAAILTARRGKNQIGNDEVADALERGLASPCPNRGRHAAVLF